MIPRSGDPAQADPAATGDETDRAGGAAVRGGRVRAFFAHLRGGSRTPVPDPVADADIPAHIQLIQAQGGVSRRLVSGYTVPVLTTLIIVAVLAVQIFMLWQARQDAWTRALAEGNGILQSVGDALEKNFTIVEQNLTRAQTAIESGDKDGVRPRDLILFDRAIPADLLNVMLIISRRGDVLVESGGLAPSPVNLADRDYFRAHVLQNPGTFLSAPFRSRYRSGDPTLAMSRRISAPDGSFNGVVMAGIRLAYLRSLLDLVRVGPNSSIALISHGGKILARSPALGTDGNFGADLRDGGILHRMMASGQPFVDEGLIGGPERLFVYRQIGPLPIILSVGLATADIYAEWNRQALIFGTLTLGFCIALALLVRGLQRGLIRSTEMEEMLKNMALTDVLTGLPNRRSFDERLDTEMRRMAREARSMSLLLVDVDGLQAVNEAYGVVTGDRLLRMLGRQIQRSVGRPGDVAARFGGEEFAVLLPDTDLKGAKYIADRIRSDVENSSMALETGERICCTVSIGIVTAWPTGRERPTHFVRMAEEALEEAKAAGRNRVSWRDCSGDPAPMGPDAGTPETPAPHAF